MLFDFSFKTKGILSIIGGFILHLMLGEYYLWGNINIYFTSYYRIISEPDLKTTKSALLIPIIDLIGIVGMFLAPNIISKIGLRVTTIIFGTLLALNMLICSFMPNFATFMLCYGLIFGFGFGLLWILPISNIYLYYPKHKGLFSGIILCGIGVGTLLSSFIAQVAINPNNQAGVSINEDEQYFDENIAMNFPYGLRIVALYTIGVTIIATLFLFPYNYEEERKQREVEFSKTDINRKLLDTFEAETNRSIMNKEAENPKSKQKKPDRRTLKEKDFDVIDRQTSFTQAIRTLFPHLMFLMNLFSWIGLFIYVNHFKNYGILKLRDDKFLTLVGSVSGVCNGLARIICGILGDKYGFKKIFAILMFVQALFLTSIPFIATERWAYLLWSCIIFTCLGGQVPLLPAICAQYLGEKTAAQIYAYVGLSTNFSNFIQYFIVLYSSPTLGLGPMMFLAGFSTLIAFVMTLFLQPPKTNILKC